METRFKRICITGASGTGKTTLAKHISGTYGIPFVNSSSGVLWDDYGYKHHNDVVRDVWDRPAIAHRFQESILSYRNELWESKSKMITDRGPIDQMAYYLDYFQIINDELTKDVFINKLVMQLIHNFDAVIFIKFNQPSIENNHRRILDWYFQLVIDSIMESIFDKIISKLKIPTLSIREWNWDTRVDMIKHFMR